MKDQTAIEELARRCAVKGLRLRDAVDLFLALYRADALAQTGGNVTKAAELAGVNREALQRARRNYRNSEGASESSKSE